MAHSSYWKPQPFLCRCSWFSDVMFSRLKSKAGVVQWWYLRCSPIPIPMPGVGKRGTCLPLIKLPLVKVISFPFSLKVPVECNPWKNNSTMMACHCGRRKEKGKDRTGKHNIYLLFISFLLHGIIKSVSKEPSSELNNCSCTLSMEISWTFSPNKSSWKPLIYVFGQLSPSTECFL